MCGEIRSLEERFMTWPILLWVETFCPYTSSEMGAWENWSGGADPQSCEGEEKLTEMFTDELTTSPSLAKDLKVFMTDWSSFPFMWSPFWPLQNSWTTLPVCMSTLPNPSEMGLGEDAWQQLVSGKASPSRSGWWYLVVWLPLEVREGWCGCGPSLLPYLVAKVINLICEGS